MSRKAIVEPGRLSAPCTFFPLGADAADGKQNDYGLGWELYFDGGKLIGYGHNGSWGGFRTSYYRYLTADRSTVILSNRGDFDADDFWYPLNDLIEEHLEK